MSISDKKGLMNENARLKQRVEAVQNELLTVKSSRAYSTIRLIGHAKNQFKDSPINFTKKAIKKLIKGGGISGGTAFARKNLSLQSSLQEQYDEWIAFNEPDRTALDNQVKAVGAFKYKPLISIVTPVFNPPADVFIELIESVRGQTYEKFELCLGDFGDSQEIRDIIASYAKKDSRIKSLQFTENKGIAENSNQILAKTKGEYIALLDHDDTLSLDALYENVKLLNEDDYDFIYSDKDKIDDKGNRFDPFFKPAWSPEIMLNANYLTHLNLMRTSIVNKVGGWDSSTDGAQDWDIFLKVIAHSKKVAHIPKVLYHWRVIATSTAFSLETKPYALAGQRFAVDKYLKTIKAAGESYHIGAELLIKWKQTAKNPLIVIRSHNSAYLRDLIADINAADKDNVFSHTKNIVIFHNYESDLIKENKARLSFVKYEESNYLTKLAEVLEAHADENVLFFDDRLVPTLTNDDVNNLEGWLAINGVKAVAPRVNRSDMFAIDCGANITTSGIRPLFAGSPPYHQAAMGNVEWVRDLRVLNPYVFVSKVKFIQAAIKAVSKAEIDDEIAHTALHLNLSDKGRLVFNPKTNVVARENNNINVHQYYLEATSLVEASDKDPYMNPNLSAEDPMMITKVIQSNEYDEPISELTEGYQNEALVHALSRRLTQKELLENYKHIDATKKDVLKKVNTAMIILPDFSAIYAGLNNIFFFADNLSKQQGTKITFALMTADKSLDRQQQLVAEKYPELAKHSEFIGINSSNLDKLPAVDVAVCTQWATAYILARYNKSKRKCYFIQDKEASFYPKGSISALVDNTYTFGFYALANTEGLLDWYKKEFNGFGTTLRSNIDLTAYNPPKTLNTHPKAPYKVFFYARPNEPRNAFEIGVASMVELKKRLGKDLEIYAAGADWDPIDYGLQDTLTNLGKISYDTLPSFYRDMDAGMMLMFSGHPGVVASELMASGTPVIVNTYEDSTWHDLYRDGTTAIVSRVTADAIADSFEKVLKDTDLRTTLITNGISKAASFYGGYQESFAHAIQDLSKTNKS